VNLLGGGGKRKIRKKYLIWGKIEDHLEDNKKRRGGVWKKNKVDR